MTTKELLRDKLAPAVGRVILKYAFGVDVSTIGGPFLDWLSATFKDQDQARQAERFARNIANGVVDSLVPVFEQEHSPGLNPEGLRSPSATRWISTSMAGSSSHTILTLSSSPRVHSISAHSPS